MGRLLVGGFIWSMLAVSAIGALLIAVFVAVTWPALIAVALAITIPAAAILGALQFGTVAVKAITGK